MLEERISLHELNNALTVIAGTTQQLAMRLKDNPDIYVHDKLSMLRQAISRAVSIAQKSGWEFAKPENRAIDVAAQVREMSGILHMLADNKVALHMNADLECLADADPVEVEGFIVNLVKNAVEASSSKGSIEVSVSPENCAVHCSACGMGIMGRYVVLTVTDDGQGIPPEHLNRIFEQGFTTKKKGQGIGLYNLRAKAHLMGGHVTVSSSPGCTTFKVYLPPAKTSPAKAHLHTAVPEGKKAIVLANNGGGFALLDYLRELNIKAVYNFQSADLILYDSDSDMEEDALVKIYAREKNIPVVCITDYLVGDSPVGNSYYLTKPFDREKFASVVTRALSQAG